MNKRHTTQWFINHLKILKVLNEGKKTYYKIFLETDLTPRTIYSHRKEIIKCPKCDFYTDKQEFCLICRFKLIGVLKWMKKVN